MTINVDAMPVENEEEALTLMLHHLKLAAMYFEATPEAIDPRHLDHFSALAMAAWLVEMERLYPQD